MLKRLFDIVLAVVLLIVFAPLILIFSFRIWNQDKKSPLYIADRVGKGEKVFKMYKFRSMIINADKSGVDSTSANDNRITPLGKQIRKYKIDEIPNFINILIGDMSFVGPRPNVKRETDLYTSDEKELLHVRPGITDFASIVFSDEGEILKNSLDPDLDYNQLIRPWKSRLGLFYVNHKSLILDIKLIIYTAIAILSKKTSLALVVRLLVKYKCEKRIVEVCKREKPLTPYSPPGSNKIVTSRV